MKDTGATQSKAVPHLSVGIDAKASLLKLLPNFKEEEAAIAIHRSDQRHSQRSKEQPGSC